MTVNCARLVKTDQHATNGIVHVVDRVITAVTNNVQSFLDTDDDLTTLQVWCYFLSLYFLARNVSECFYKIFCYSQQLCIIYYIDVRYFEVFILDLSLYYAQNSLIIFYFRKLSMMLVLPHCWRVRVPIHYLLQPMKHLRRFLKKCWTESWAIQ